MLRNTNLITYLPPILQDKKEYIQICKSSNSEFALLFSSIDNVLKDQFLSELTINGAKRWEKIMKITPKASDTLEDRRFRIMNRFLNKLPYTMRSLHQTLTTLCGPNGYKIEYDSSTYTLKVRLELTAKNQLDEVVRSLKYIIPTNIVQDISLLYNQHQIVSKMTHSQLNSFIHKDIREEALSNERDC